MSFFKSFIKRDHVMSISKKERLKKLLTKGNIILAASAAVFIAVCAAIIAVSYIPKVYANVVAEAGSTVTEDEFFEKNMPSDACFLSDTEGMTSKVGEYEIVIKSGKKEYHSTLSVVDTVPPTAKAAEDAFTWGGILPEPEDCVTDVYDATSLRYEWKDKPYIYEDGNKTGTVLITDEGGNCTEIAVSVLVIVDDTPPEITGICDMTLYLGEEIDYKSGVEVVDDKDSSAVLEIDDGELDLYKEGEYTVVYRAYDGAGNESYASAVITLLSEEEPPKITGARDIKIPIGTVYDLESLVSVTDDHDVSPCLAVEHDVNFDKEGEYTVTYRASDRSGNESAAEVKAVVAVDVTPPDIGAFDFSIFLGDNVSYRKNAHVTDDFVGEVSLDIDSGEVDLEKIGTYPVTYKATDASGNSSSKTVYLTIEERPVMLDEVLRMADEVLSEITDDSMTPMQKAYAIFKWCQAAYSYIGTSVKTDWVSGAYEGFTTKKGDCYTAFALAKALLTEAGIENADVVKVKRVPTQGSHFWNLINLGDGWYHFDSCVFKYKNDLFMLTDEELADWDNKYYRDGHRFDGSVLPERATESVQQLIDYSKSTLD